MSNQSGRRTIIRNQIGQGTTSLASSTAELRQQVLGQRTQSKRRKKSSGPSASKIAAYTGAFLLFIAVIAVGYESPRQVSSQVANVNQEVAAPVAGDDESAAPAIDQVVATGVAAELAQRANLPIASSAASMSVSLAVKSELAQTDSSAITKPQIIKPTSSNGTITTYTVKSGDSVPEVASRFGISSNTVRWANNLPDTDALEPGRKLTILPYDGLLYTVQSGESIQDIANKFSSNVDRITLVNNLDLSGVKAGQRIIVPEGVKPAPEPTPTQSFTGGGSYGGGSIISNGMVGVSAGNRYAPGNCTWYAYERRAQLGRPIGSFWGNANTWDSSAVAAGFRTGNIPRVGAVMQWDEYSEPYISYAGHVAIVERVKSNGDIVISEMNNGAYGGFNIVNTRTISAGQARLHEFIY